MIVKEYCGSMQKQLAAWRANVQKLLMIAEALSGEDPQADTKRIEDLKSLIQDIGKASDMLKYECLIA